MLLVLYSSCKTIIKLIELPFLFNYAHSPVSGMLLVLYSSCKTIIKLIELSFLFNYAHSPCISLLSICSMSNIFFVYLLHPRLVDPCFLRIFASS
jgi:ABC-type iron transport system FetAB permease component